MIDFEDLKRRAEELDRRAHEEGYAPPKISGAVSIFPSVLKDHPPNVYTFEYQRSTTQLEAQLPMFEFFQAIGIGEISDAPLESSTRPPKKQAVKIKAVDSYVPTVVEGKPKAKWAKHTQPGKGKQAREDTHRVANMAAKDFVEYEDALGRAQSEVDKADGCCCGKRKKTDKDAAVAMLLTLTTLHEEGKAHSKKLRGMEKQVWMSKSVADFEQFKALCASETDWAQALVLDMVSVHAADISRS